MHKYLVVYIRSGGIDVETLVSVGNYEHTSGFPLSEELLRELHKELSIHTNNRVCTILNIIELRVL